MLRRKLALLLRERKREALSAGKISYGDRLSLASVPVGIAKIDTRISDLSPLSRASYASPALDTTNLPPEQVPLEAPGLATS